MCPNQFQGHKVRLCAIEPEDWEALLALEEDTDLVRRSSLVRLPASRAAAQAWADELSRRPSGDEVTLAIKTLGGTLVGIVDIGLADQRNRVFSYGVSIGREHRRNGFATEAVVLLLRYYFAELGYEKAEGTVFSFNRPSIQFHTSLGFQREGVRRRSVFSHGQYFDRILFGLTAEEFYARHGNSLGAQ